MSTKNENPALAGGVSEDGHAAALIVSEDTPTAAPVQAHAYAFHPLADIFPLLEGDEFEALSADIKRNGLHEPIILLDDQILDGRNRYRACIAAGVEPTYRAFQGDDPAAFVISANIRRRHLTLEQKRELIEKLLEAEPTKSNRQVAKTVGVSHPHVAKVRDELEKAGDVETVTTSIDTKGRQQPSKRPKSRTERRRVGLERKREHVARLRASLESAAEDVEDDTTTAAPQLVSDETIVAATPDPNPLIAADADPLPETFVALQHKVQELLRDAPETWLEWVQDYARAELNRRRAAP